MSEEVLQGSVEREGIEIRWIMPEGFFELPMEAEDEDEIGERLVDLARRALPGADFEIQLQWAVMCAANYGAFAEAGVQYAGFCMTEVDGTRCTATVNVSLFDLDARAGSDPAGFIASSMRYLDSGQVAQIDLPCGPAVSCIGNRQAPVDGSITASESDEAVWTSFIQIQVPMSNGTVLMMEMSTPTAEGWETFSSMFAGVVKSIRLFDVDGEPLVMPG
ncbi:MULTISPECIES: hypothetical protein [unclassified Streptomyces]|uniref:hypothetical protein n=1 Tax=unclassified Streptomyces TaxID=2593676 RepID=UPI002DD9AECE|nr:hypothetical protein [Streptomyces sp. NBC_01766]WSC20603.1 hypothetical protein OIE60_13395 [Streptomyces sp. NBC_01766]WSV54632.1 hypothetical protein OG282_13450 [Streptomyces sp. NBC_01014]